MVWNTRAAIGGGEGTRESLSTILLIILIVIMAAFFLYKLWSLRNLSP